ncbi:MAG: protein kinase [Elusimicrobia bacterium]|nr:protein kinase [Elusimicrobiota bacterium]
MKKLYKTLFIVLLPAFFAGNAPAQTAADYAGQGTACFRKSDYTNAITYWNKALSLDPKLGGQLKPHLFQAYKQRGADYYLDKEFEKSIADLDAALAIDPDSAGIREARAVAEKALKKSRKAVAKSQSPDKTAPKPAAPVEDSSGFPTGQVIFFAFAALGLGGLGIWGFNKFRVTQVLWKAPPTLALPREGGGKGGGEQLQFRDNAGKETPIIKAALPDVAAVESDKKPEEKPATKAEPIQQKPALSPIQTGAEVPGQVLDGRYELRGTLGEGGMGVVIEAWDRQLKRRAAVKRMHAFLKEYPEEYDRFRREAEIVGKLRHPNIIGVHGIIEHGGEIYLVFDYIDGKSLSAVLKDRKRFPLKDCKNILKGVCEAVHYAHKNNVIHRDLKPANIMLDSGGYAMVMDFGLASELRESFTRVSHQTMSGTPAYMAPEQNRGVVKRESDIYALGICFYEMLTGELPFGGFDSLEQKKSGDYKAVSAILPWLPAGLDSAIARALEPEPSQRYADALDFYDAFKDL